MLVKGKLNLAGGYMKRISLMLTAMLMFATLAMPVFAYDASNPYTVTMNFIVGDDSSFTVTLAGIETTIDFNPATSNSKEVEPDSQNAGESTPIAEITNTGNVALDFTHKLNATVADVSVSFNNANTVDWGNVLSGSYTTIESSVASTTSSSLYLWANFTNTGSGTFIRTYQVNSTISA